MGSTGWFGTRRATNSRDVVLGAAMVAAYAFIVAATCPGLETASPHDTVVALTIAGATVAAGLGLVAVPWRRLPVQSLIAFPLLIVASEVALAAFTNGIASNYTGFFTLVFLYVGLTQSPGVPLLFTLVVAPSWVYCQEQLAVAVWVKLALGATIWILLGEILATRTAQDRARTWTLLRRANTDVLTGLASRLLLADQIERALRDTTTASGSLLLLDLDGFKSVNDTFGHAAGDELLIAVADRIRGNLRPGDTAARLGGDEFAVLLRDRNVVQAEAVARRLLQAMAEPVGLSRGRVAVTASIGVARVGGQSGAQEVLRDADLAMYDAKSAGRNRASRFEADMQEQMAQRLRLETELRDGMERGEFELYYQPIVHMQTGTVIGTEALVRWNHPERGVLTPDQFLGASEDIGLIVPLGHWILHQACRQASEWQPVDPAHAVTMALNLSAPEMFTGDITAEVEAALREAELPGELLVVEITERLLMADAPAVRHRLEELKRLGVRIAIDDFGTGYSSLAYLREFPVDILKIDQSFVRPLGNDPQAVALLRSIVAIAEALRLDVIVEGVESPVQLGVVTGLGCEVAQGYYFGRPAGAETIGALLDRPARAFRADAP
jgi:diguanylate cyclase (GGDEF)-like protein